MDWVTAAAVAIGAAGLGAAYLRARLGTARNVPVPPRYRAHLRTPPLGPVLDELDGGRGRTTKGYRR